MIRYMSFFGFDDDGYRSVTYRFFFWKKDSFSRRRCVRECDEGYRWFVVVVGWCHLWWKWCEGEGAPLSMMTNHHREPQIGKDRVAVVPRSIDVGVETIVGCDFPIGEITMFRENIPG